MKCQKLTRDYCWEYFWAITFSCEHVSNINSKMKRDVLSKRERRVLMWIILRGRTFRENHKMWLRIQDTTISYLIARNPRLKKTNRVHYAQSLQLQWHLITNIINLTCLCLCLFVLSSLSPGTWRGECPAWPCPLGWVSLPVGAKVASSPHTPDNQRDVICGRFQIVSATWHLHVKRNIVQL